MASLQFLADFVSSRTEDAYRMSRSASEKLTGESKQVERDHAGSRIALLLKFLIFALFGAAADHHQGSQESDRDGNSPTRKVAEHYGSLSNFTPSFETDECYKLARRSATRWQLPNMGR